MSRPGSGNRKSAAYDKAQQAIARRSDWVFTFFAFIFEHAIKRDFNAVRLARDVAGPETDTPRLVIYTNHPSWWDATVYAFLGRRMFGNRPVYSPIDADMLAHYPFMARIGAFGVEQGTARGAADFLAASRIVLAKPEAILIVACQGRFADVRERPLHLEAGIAHLPELAPGATFVPLAIEYVPWTERRPELLLRFGTPHSGDVLKSMPRAERLRRLEAGLEDAMSALAMQAIARDPAAFQSLLAGARGVNPVYDWWRRLVAALRGKSYRASHGREPS